LKTLEVPKRALGFLLSRELPL